MALNNITFIKGKGGLAKTLPGTDYVSGIIFYDNVFPSGFGTYSNVKDIYSVYEAEQLGILADFSDETKATATITISGTGSTGDQISVKMVEGGVNGTKQIVSGSLVDAVYSTVDITTYTKSATDTTLALTATGLSDSINLNTTTHGYVASATGSVVTITAKKGLGVFPNTKSLTIVTQGTVATTTTAFTGGVASKSVVKHYHISEYFRLQPQGKLYVGIFPVPSTYTFSEINTMSTLSEGSIRQIGIYQDSKAYDVADLALIKSVVSSIDAEINPLSVLFAPNLSATTNVLSISDLSVLDNPKVSVLISQDCGNLGNKLAWATAKSITNLGSLLGAVSLSKVSESIAWVSKFNLSDGYELERIGFSNGVPSTDSSISTSTLNVLNNKRYIFLRKLSNVNGTFFNDSHTACLVSSDYSYIELNRTIDKVIRFVYSDLITYLNGPLALNSDGTLQDYVATYLESIALNKASNMVRENEASSIVVKVDRKEVVSTSSTVNVEISIVPIGVARNIIVNVGFKASL